MKDRHELAVYTFMMAGYDGPLIALLLVTMVALVVWIVQRSWFLVRGFSRR